MSATATNALETRDYILRLEVDDSPTNPLEDFDGQWTLYTFKEGRADCATNIVSLERFFPQSEATGAYVPTLAIRNKLRAGTAFLMDYYDNWQGTWSVCPHETDPDGHEGLLVWENAISDMGSKTYEGRAADAASCIGEYNKWATGEVYGYDLTAREGGPITSYTTGDGKGGWSTQASESDSCWGFIGADYFVEMLRDELLPSYASDYPIRVLVTGQAADLIERGKGLDGIPNVEIVEHFTDDGDEEIDEY